MTGPESRGAEYPERRSLRSLQETARFFRVSPPTVRSWIDAGCPVAEAGGPGREYKLDLDAVHRWRQARDAASAAERQAKIEADQRKQLELLGPDMLPQDDDGPLTPAQKRDTLAGEVARVKLAELRGRLVDADELQADLVTAGTELRLRVVAAPELIGRRFNLPEAVVAALTAELEAVLTDFADAAAAALPGANGARAA